MEPSLAYLVDKANPYPVSKAEWLRQIAQLRSHPVYVFYTRQLTPIVASKTKAVLGTAPSDDGEEREREQLIGEIRGMGMLEWILDSEVSDIQQQLKEPTNENPDDNGE